ncbi:MAG: hypothetical protein JW720_13145 [Sedimentisphaerales bacterium]|nr:hypothetical protein [Sedimentisphaerales bacterium]
MKVCRVMLVGLIGALSLLTETAYSENIDPYEDDSRYAYGQNVGWINFDPNIPIPVVGAKVTVEKLTGLIWAENIGWINLDPNDTDPDSGVKNNPAGELSGYAWAENVGWINFNPVVPGDPARYGVTIDEFGNFHGWAWGQNIGWIHFSSNTPVQYKVRTCVVRFDDLANFADDWLTIGPGLPGDLTAPAIIDEADYAVFAWYWHDYCPDGWRLKLE